MRKTVTTMIKIKNTDTIQYYRMVLIEGWCSEYLNPLSGQSGKIVQSMVIYEISCRSHGGAIIRTDLELTSSSIIHTNMIKSSTSSSNNTTTTKTTKTAINCFFFFIFFIFINIFDNNIIII